MTAAPAVAPARRRPAREHAYGPGWTHFLWPPFVLALLLLVLPQAVFVAMSLYRNLGMGMVDEAVTFENYRRVLTDPYYLQSMAMTVYLSAGATAIGLLLAFPTAYLLARLRSRWVSYLIVLLLISSFVTVVIKVLGLSLLIDQEGLINRVLRALGVIDRALAMTNNQAGVLIGLVQYTLPLLVMLLFSVVQTIPRSLEEAAEIHGATWRSMLARVLLPLAKPGLIGGALIAFNMNMGAFTSAVLLGGGKVLTLPVLIQRKIILDVDYPTGAALSTVLLVVVLLLNLGLALALRRGRRRRILRGGAA